MKKAIITGHLGKDPEKRVTQAGDEFVMFTVAVNGGTKQNKKTDWVDVTCYYKLAELAYTYLKKGSKVLVMGTPSVNAYITKTNDAIATLRILATELEFLSSKNDTTSNNQDYKYTQQNQQSAVNNINNINNDYIPF